MKMGWTCDADEKREKTLENATHKNGGKTTKKKAKNQMDRPNYKGSRNERRKLVRKT